MVAADKPLRDRSTTCRRAARSASSRSAARRSSGRRWPRTSTGGRSPRARTTCRWRSPTSTSAPDLVLKGDLCAGVDVDLQRHPVPDGRQGEGSVRQQVGLAALRASKYVPGHEGMNSNNFVVAEELVRRAPRGGRVLPRGLAARAAGVGRTTSDAILEGLPGRLRLQERRGARVPQGLVRRPSSTSSWTRCTWTRTWIKGEAKVTDLLADGRPGARGPAAADPRVHRPGERRGDLPASRPIVTRDPSESIARATRPPTHARIGAPPVEPTRSSSDRRRDDGRRAGGGRRPPTRCSGAIVPAGRWQSSRGYTRTEFELLPSPLEVAQRMGTTSSGTRPEASRPAGSSSTSGRRSARRCIGFVGAVVVGVPIGILMGRYRYAKNFFFDFVYLAANVPLIVYAIVGSAPVRARRRRAGVRRRRCWCSGHRAERGRGGRGRGPEPAVDEPRIRAADGDRAPAHRRPVVRAVPVRRVARLVRRVVEAGGARGDVRWDHRGRGADPEGVPGRSP